MGRGGRLLSSMDSSFHSGSYLLIELKCFVDIFHHQLWQTANLMYSSAFNLEQITMQSHSHLLIICPGDL